MRKWGAALVLGLMALWSGGARAQDAPVVRIDSGPLRGIADQGVASFRNIPYAAPPVGRLRWRPPQAPKAWTRVRDASDFGPICPQNYNPSDNGVGPLPASEDCLTLNVWTPALDGVKRPVMVWFHGGALAVGSA